MSLARDKERGKKDGEENFDELQSLSLEYKGVNEIAQKTKFVEDIYTLQQSLNGWVPGSASSASGDGELCPRDRDQ